MATHSSVLTWRIPGTGEPGGLPSMGSHRVGHDWSDLPVSSIVVGSLCSWEEVRTWPSDISTLTQNLIFRFVFGVFGGGAGVCVHVRVCVHIHVCLLLPVPCVSDAIVVVSCFFPPLITTWTRAAGPQIRIRSLGQQCAIREFVSTIFTSFWLRLVHTFASPNEETVSGCRFSGNGAEEVLRKFWI